MRFMIIVRASADSESGVMPGAQRVAEMGRYHEELAQAGVLLDGHGLMPSAEGWRVRYHGGTATVVDGPFTETRELIAGYTLIQVRSRDEAMDWARRFPAPFGALADGEIEVRPLVEPVDFPPGASSDRLRPSPATR